MRLLNGHPYPLVRVFEVSLFNCDIYSNNETHLFSTSHCFFLSFTILSYRMQPSLFLFRRFSWLAFARSQVKNPCPVIPSLMPTTNPDGASCPTCITAASSSNPKTAGFRFASPTPACVSSTSSVSMPSSPIFALAAKKSKPLVGSFF